MWLLQTVLQLEVLSMVTGKLCAKTNNPFQFGLGMRLETLMYKGIRAD